MDLLTYSLTLVRRSWWRDVDVDECVLRTANCHGEDDVCINTRGGYKCQTVTCPRGFIKAPVIGNRSKSEPTYLLTKLPTRLALMRKHVIVLTGESVAWY